MLSKNDGKGEARYAARLDVLTERVDTLAATVATTASSMARKDGEIASLKRELESRQPSAPADRAELDELRRAVAALQATAASPAGDSGAVDELASRIALLAERLDAVSETVSSTAAGLASREDELAALRVRVDERPDEQQPSDELRSMLTTLRAHVESLDGLRGGVSQEQLEERLAETDDSLSRLVRRFELLSDKVERAASGLEQKERELEALQQHAIDASARLETIVDDLRQALGSLPEPDPEALVELSSRVDATDGATSSLGRRLDRLESTAIGELAERLELLDRRVATLAEDIGRAKTLWPVALRSLEARLDDVARVQGAEHDHGSGADGHEDLLAGLRDSLQAMESVAAELGRGPEADVMPDDDAEAAFDDAVYSAEPDEEEPAAQEAVGGARIVPLRQSDP